jgi:predicted hydrocarbon binding protein
VFKSSGRSAGEQLGQHLDRELVRLGQPALSALPLEACLVLVERYFAAQGWGVLQLDLSDAAEHGLVIARLEHSYFVEALADVEGFVDPLAAGFLRGFVEYISGQPLGCEEIGCARAGAPRCVFVITAEERLAAVIPLIGREAAEEILNRLKT